ncbi:hypothetical protein RICGR_1252 [Rickettsiella grylli]|uniref:Uncharacterized protein n=1 Tax=Rickettsiella grylli TaxID=59196 RepID=A8PPA8_9COXI|nr:hypothetical protein RICGR_1252 [Rickettsiella grylli]
MRYEATEIVRFSILLKTAFNRDIQDGIEHIIEALKKGI